MSMRNATSTPPVAVDEAPPQRRRRARWPWMAAGALAVVAVGAGAYAMTRGDDGHAAAPAVAASAVAEQSGAEGAFAFTVTGSRCGVETVGPADLAQRPAGQFCLVDVSVRNVGKDAELLDSGAQRAVDTQGRQYSVSDRAAVFLNDQDPTLLEEIKPGATVRGTLPFDVPAGTRLGAVVLHESVTTPGVRLSLS
jgi:hypothetical protein